MAEGGIMVEEQIEKESFVTGVYNTIVGALKYLGLSTIMAITYSGISSLIFDKPFSLGGFILAWIVAFIVVLRRF